MLTTPRLYVLVHSTNITTTLLLTSTNRQIAREVLQKFGSTTSVQKTALILSTVRFVGTSLFLQKFEEEGNRRIDDLQ